MRPIKSSVIIRRGDIFNINLGNSFKNLRRPILVIQNDIGNKYCQSVIVVPLTTLRKVKKLLFSVPIPANTKTGLKEEHVALFSQIRTLQKDRFTNDSYLGRIDSDTLKKVDEAIMLSLGLSTIQKLQNKMEAKREVKTISSRIG